MAVGRSFAFAFAGCVTFEYTICDLALEVGQSRDWRHLRTLQLQLADVNVVARAGKQRFESEKVRAVALDFANPVHPDFAFGVLAPMRRLL